MSPDVSPPPAPPDRDWIPRRPVAFARAVSRPHARWAAASMLAVLVATAASRVMTWTLKLLTDAAIAFGQGRCEIGEVWRWGLVFPGAYLANEVVWRTTPRRTSPTASPGRSSTRSRTPRRAPSGSSRSGFVAVHASLWNSQVSGFIPD